MGEAKASDHQVQYARFDLRESSHPLRFLFSALLGHPPAPHRAIYIYQGRIDNQSADRLG